MTFVLDASVAMSWCFEDETTPASENVLDLLAVQDALVPALWVYEVTNVLAVAERRRRLTEAQSAHFLDLLHQLPIGVAESPPDATALLDVARRHQISAYDAAYLALAAQHGLALATLDSQLAARASDAGVTVLS
ncbi:MAG: type II toxin-antitoxin system VapC family toxin [Frankiaceae bacterium]|nr:type II toxin-antitoxin system VapC family toxin [Frankiaceae bacterium]